VRHPPCFNTTAALELDRLLSEVLVEEPGDLLEGFLGLRRTDVAVILRVRLALENLQHRVDAGLAQLAMHAHRAAEQQVARAVAKTDTLEGGTGSDDPSMSESGQSRSFQAV
jgi:hypothetical protein